MRVGQYKEAERREKVTFMDKKILLVRAKRGSYFKYLHCTLQISTDCCIS